MSMRNSIAIGLWVVMAALGLSPQALAMLDKDNQGRWLKPTVNNQPDKEVPGFLVNLGPTGARAILTEKTFVVRYIFADSPAVGRLKLDDEIVGVFGKPFSPHHFGGGGLGYEGPMMDFGDAIEKAEGCDGKLVLNVSRGSQALEVKIDLEPIGAFSATFPFNCKKSECVRAKALKYLADHPDGQGSGVWQAHAHSAVILAFLTSDDPKQQSLGKQMALKWSKQSPDAGTWTWGLSYQLITLGEYHLLTRDPSVLPMMKIVSGYLEKAQYKGNIVCWKECQTDEKWKALQQLYDGGFGHGPYKAELGVNGYGPMQYTTILALIGWQIAERCGVAVDPQRLTSAMAFIHHGTNAAGYVAYGGEFALNNGPQDPVGFKKGTGGDNYVGRSGAALIAHKLSPDFPESAKYIVDYRKYIKRAYKSLPNGHADANLGIIWGLLGAGASEDDTAVRKVFDYHKSYMNMMRCFDGSFVLLPGRDYADNGYYMASRYHPTATMILALGLSSPKLLIQGIQANISGVNPKALKGNMDAAYKAIVKKAYNEAASTLKGAKGDDAPIAAAMNEYIDVQLQRDIAELDALEKVGDICKLDSELTKVRARFGTFDGLKDKLKHFQDGLSQDAWKMELKLGNNYRQLVDQLQRNKNASYANDLQKFSDKHPDSTYGKWASEVAKEFLASGSIKDPANIKLVVSTPGAVASTPAPASDDASPASTPTNSALSEVKVVAAKPAPVPVKAPAVLPEALEKWQTRFVEKLNALAKSGVKVTLRMSGQDNYPVRGATEKTIIVSVQGNDLPMPWKQISPECRAQLAKDAAKDDDVEALLIAAVLNLSIGKTDVAEDCFAKACPATIIPPAPLPHCKMLPRFFRCPTPL